MKKLLLILVIMCGCCPTKPIATERKPVKHTSGTGIGISANGYVGPKVGPFIMTPKGLSPGFGF